MTNTEILRDWFLGCPAIQEVMGFNADYLDENPNMCSIYSLPSSLNYTEDVMGNISYRGRQTLSFVLALSAPYGSDVRQNLENLQFFSEVKEWMYTQNTLKNLPEINEGEVVSVMATQTEAVATATADTATYQMRFDLIYWRSV